MLEGDIRLGEMEYRPVVYEERPSSRPFVVVPTYEEAENIERVIGLICDAVPQATVLVVDDSSPDGTAEIAKKLAERGLPVQVMVREGKLGLGSAYRAGFAEAVRQGATACIEIDADLSHDPKAIPQLLAACDRGAALAIGSRYVAGGSSPGLSPFRLLISRGGNLYAALLLGITVRDATAGFRCYRRETIQGIDLESVRADGYGFQVEMTYIVHKNGGRIDEIPIEFRDREMGGSKMSGRIVAEAMVLCTLWGLARVFPRLGRRQVEESVVRIFRDVYQKVEHFASNARH
jgi:dolichol-phosphate mannosyltransferase